MRTYFAITAAAVALVPLSVSASQTLMALSLIFSMALVASNWRRNTNGPMVVAGPEQSFKWGPPVWKRIQRNPAAAASWFLFFYLALVYAIRSLQYLLDTSNVIFQPRPFHNELTDFFLFLFAWLAFLHSQQYRNSPAASSAGQKAPNAPSRTDGAPEDLQATATGQDLSPRSLPNANSEARKKEHIYTWILNALTVFALLTVLSGLLAMFTEVRLSKLFTGHGHEFSATNRPQFVFRSFGDFTLYRPIGFMNTRLSYAGILLFSFAILLHRSLISLKVTLLHPSLATLGRTLLWIFFCGIGILALLMNGSRSGQIGSTITIVLILLYHGRALGTALSANARKRLQGRRATVSIWMVAFVLALIAFGVLYVVGLQSGTHRHTDYMRPVIWKGALALFQESPLLGVGPGNYPDAFHRWAQQFYLDHPRTMYFLEITPDSHAHNDLLHLLALGGLPAGMAFLALILFSLHSLASLWDLSGKTAATYLRSSMQSSAYAHPVPDRRDDPDDPGNIVKRSTTPMDSVAILDLEWALRSALPGFFVAGLSQCYFQDDEVVVVFWAFLFAAEILKRLRH